MRERERERKRKEGRNNEITLQLADPGGLLDREKEKGARERQS